MLLFDHQAGRQAAEISCQKLMTPGGGPVAEIHIKCASGDLLDQFSAPYRGHLNGKLVLNRSKGKRFIELVLNFRPVVQCHDSTFYRSIFESK